MTKELRAVPLVWSSVESEAAGDPTSASSSSSSGGGGGGGGGVDVALLTGLGEIRVFRLAKAEGSGDNATETNSTSSSGSTTTGDSTSSSSDHFYTLVKEMATSDPFSQLLTGGGACRYCVKDCPDMT